MGFIRRIRRLVGGKKEVESVGHREVYVEEFGVDDFLAKAANAGRKGLTAVGEGSYDKAWKHFHEQKSYYLQHASSQDFSTRDTLVLDASVHEQLANILRLEKKHDDALVSIVYWVIAQSERPKKKHQQKLKAYFNRCKFQNTTLEEAQAYVGRPCKLPEFQLAQSQVAQWRTAK